MNQLQLTVYPTTPDDSTSLEAGGWLHARWSVRRIAAATAISPTSVHRYFKLLGLQPHRSASFTLSIDQFFIEKLRDVVGLYLSPPEHALVLCVDEKSQCQALERTQPMLPMGFSYVEGVTHDVPDRVV